MVNLPTLKGLKDKFRGRGAITVTGVLANAILVQAVHRNGLVRVREVPRRT